LGYRNKFLQSPQVIVDDHGESLNSAPVIGILTCEFDIMNTGDPVESLPSTYTNFLESAGARTVPISFKWDKKRIYEALDQVNGILFTGGDIEQYDYEKHEYHPYYLTTKLILEYVIKRNNRGDYFPLFAICQGFQSLHIAIAKDPTVLSNSIRWGNNDTMNLYFTPWENSRLFTQTHEKFNPDFWNPFHDPDRIEFNWHQYGVYLSAYNKYPSLKNFFKILSYDDYEDGNPIVATVEAYNYPIYATQYHPEKNSFDFLHPSIPHNRRAQQLTEDFAFFFVNECRKNKHRFPSYSEEVSHHINNYQRYFGLFEHGGDNVYIDYYVFEDQLHN